MNVAFIPVRGGSKSIPLKNIKPLCGKPLVYWTVKAASNCKYIDKVYVSTDSEKIKEVVNNFKDESVAFNKVEIINRSEESASDTASTEFAMLEFASKFEFENIVLIQATSPLLQASDLDRGFKAFFTPETDSVLSVVPQKRFNWTKDKNGFAFPMNYDVFNRPRRQDFDGYLVENGAFYISSKSRLVKYKNRVSGNIKAVEMKEESFFEIDEPDDWKIIESIMKKNEKKEKFNVPEIKLFLTDCDGCLTDGGMYYSEHGDELKKFNTRDGMGIAMLREKGILTGIITSEEVTLNKRRAEKLKVDIYKAGCKNKFMVVDKLCKEYNIDMKNICYVGDDVNDIELLKSVGLSCAPADAIPQVRRNVDYLTKTKGGEGVIREIVEMIIEFNAI